jgi:hypothetical protein
MRLVASRSLKRVRIAPTCWVRVVTTGTSAGSAAAGAEGRGGSSSPAGLLGQSQLQLTIRGQALVCLGVASAARVAAGELRPCAVGLMLRTT